MCMGGPPPAPAAAPVMAPPPPPPPPPSPTAQGLTVGSDRREVPLQSFLTNAITANRRRGTSALRTDMGGTGGGTGLNVPI